MGHKILNKNIYNIKGDITELIITNTKGKKIIVLIDTEDLEKVKKYNWCAGWREDKQRYYIQVGIRNEDESKTTLLLHKYIMNSYGMYEQVDHKNHDSLNNTKNNLRTVKPQNNSKNRKGANKNSSTGFRNVNYASNKTEYWVQFCKNGERYKWVFPLDKFKEACEFAEKKRVELYGEYAGNN